MGYFKNKNIKTDKNAELKLIAGAGENGRVTPVIDVTNKLNSLLELLIIYCFVRKL